MRPFIVQADPEEYWLNQYNAYLTKRGISLDLADELGLALVTGTQMAEELGHPTWYRGKWAIRIPFPGTDHAIFRVFSPGKGSKIKTAKGHAPHCYIPQCLDWSKFKGELILCESPLKAISLAMHGHYAIAGSGVDGLYNRHGLAVGFPDHLINKSKIRILFDSDVVGNVNCEGAVLRVGSGILSLYPHADVSNRVLDKPHELYPDEDWGIDDAIADLGVDWLSKFMEGASDVPLELEGLSKDYADINALYAFVEKPAGIVKLSTGTHWTVGDFYNVEADRLYVTGDGPKSSARAWVKWKGRHRVPSIQYIPGGDRMEQGEYYNTWRDDGPKALEGDVAPFLEYVENMVPDEATRRCILESLAWGMQNRGTPIRKGFMMYASTLGSGKSTWLEIVRGLYGPSNCAPVSIDALTGRFNDQILRKEIVTVDETDQVPKEGMAKLERYITDDTLDMEGKNKDMQYVSNCMTIWMTSNKSTCLHLKNNDRRFVVGGCTPTIHHKQGADDYWTKLRAYLFEEGGLAHIRWWLMHMDLSGFDSNYMPPMNKEKRHMMVQGINDYDDFARQLLNYPEDVLAENWIPKERKFFTAGELEQIRVGHDYDDERLLTNAARRLGKQGIGEYFFHMNSGDPMRVLVLGVSKPRPIWNILGDENATNKEVQSNINAYPIRFPWARNLLNDGFKP